MKEMIEISAPAKVNLFLHITGRRSDGYHLLESLFAFTSKGDVIRLSASDEFEFKVTGPFAAALSAVGGAGEDNLVVGAARAFAAQENRPLELAIELEKNLPVAAGIGGGSADAAATLLALNDYWQCGYDRAQLEPLALTLGADVPACLYGHPLFVTGIGDYIEPATLPEAYHILLVNPGVAVATPEIFKAFHASGAGFDTPLGGIEAFADEGLEAFLAEQAGNSLQRPAESLCAEISAVLAALEPLPQADYVAMSGSGATCFALFRDAEAADAARKAIESSHSHWWVQLDQLQL